MDNEDLLKQVIRRLDILITLQLETVGGPEAARPATKIQRLSELGLSSAEIASIIGKPSNYVAATMAKKKKASEKKTAKKGNKENNE